MESESTTSSDGGPPPSVLSRLRAWRFRGLLGALLLLMLIAPLAGLMQSPAGFHTSRLLMLVSLAVLLLAATYATSDSRSHFRVAIALTMASLGVGLASVFSDYLALRLTQDLLAITLLGFVVCLIIRFLLNAQNVTRDTIAAALCGYLLIGVGWSAIYSLLIDLNPASFAISGTLANHAESVRFGGRDSATSLYFSFVTLTTLGYGDVTPVTMPARMLTTAEALIGQLYLAVLVARLVGMQIATQLESE